MNVTSTASQESFLGQILFTLFLYDVKSEHGNENYSKAGSHYYYRGWYQKKPAHIEDMTDKNKLKNTHWKSHV